MNGNPILYLPISKLSNDIKSKLAYSFNNDYYEMRNAPFENSIYLAPHGYINPIDNLMCSNFDGDRFPYQLKTKTE